jgi:hypothetical protein
VLPCSWRVSVLSFEYVVAVIDIGVKKLNFTLLDYSNIIFSYVFYNTYSISYIITCGPVLSIYVLYVRKWSVSHFVDVFFKSNGKCATDWSCMFQNAV